MTILWSSAQPAVKKETKRIAVASCVGTILMWIVFGVLHITMPSRVPFDYTVILGGLGGAFISVLNFFMMGMAIQKVASSTDEDSARMRMKASYSRRMLLQMLWVIIAIVAPCFQFAAGIIPLLFPGTFLKILGIAQKKI